MNPIRVSLIDTPRATESSTIAITPANPAVVPRETQQRFERLMEAKPKEPASKNTDGRSQAEGKEGAVEEDGSNEAMLADIFNRLHARIDLAGRQPSQDHSSGTTPSDRMDVELLQPGCECNEDTYTQEIIDVPAADPATDAQDASSCTIEPLASTTPLPTPLDLYSRTASNPVINPIATERVSTPVETRLVDLARAVADRILVSDVAKGTQEVHIQLKDAVLPGTEIRLREQAGQLQVNFVTDQQSSLDFLMQQQGGLNAHLEQSLARHIVVNVDFDSLTKFSSHRQSESNRRVKMGIRSHRTRAKQKQSETEAE